MFLGKEGVYLECDLQVDSDGNYSDSASKLAFIQSECLWGSFDDAKKLKSIPDGVREDLSSFCRGGSLQRILYSNAGSLGDESNHYVCHVFNDVNGNLIANYFDGSSFDFDNAGGRFIFPTYVSDCYFNCSEKINISDLTASIGYLLGYCNKHNISDVFIVGDDNMYNSFDAYVIKSESDYTHVGIMSGDYTLICIKRGIPFYDELQFPVKSDYATYDKDSFLYADELSNLL